MNATKSKMKILGKVLTIIAALAVVGLICVGAVVYWWDHNASALLDGAKSATAEGLRYGADRKEAACVLGALERHRNDWNRSIISSVHTGAWLTGCLNASQFEERFCVGVPAPNDFIEVGTWSGGACANQGLTDPFCPNLFQGISRYCASLQRREKIGPGARPNASAA